MRITVFILLAIIASINFLWAQSTKGTSIKDSSAYNNPSNIDTLFYENFYETKNKWVTTFHYDDDKNISASLLSRDYPASYRVHNNNKDTVGISWFPYRLNEGKLNNYCVSITASRLYKSSNDPHNSYGFVFGHSGTSGGSGYLFDIKPNGKYRLVKINNGILKDRITWADAHDKKGEPYNLKVIVLNNTCKLYINGKLVNTINDYVSSGVFLGLSIYNDLTVTFNDIVVTSLKQ